MKEIGIACIVCFILCILKIPFIIGFVIIISMFGYFFIDDWKKNTYTGHNPTTNQYDRGNWSREDWEKWSYEPIPKEDIAELYRTEFTVDENGCYRYKGKH